jgi:microcystin degradation protein MlrC
MKLWFDRAREMESLQKVISVSTFPMQPWCDAAHSGWSVVVNTDGDRDLAERLAAELADMAWGLRERFWERDGIPVKDAVDKALAAEAGLAVLADMGDSVFGGASGDSTAILAELMSRSLRRPALVPIIDVPALEAASRAGLGAHVTLTVGATVDTLFAKPLTVSGRVAGLAEDLRIMLPGRGFTDAGPTALIDMGMIKLVLAKYRSWGISLPITYQRFGIDPGGAALVVVKTASNFQHFSRWQREAIRVDSPGLSQSDLNAFPWKRVRRPVWPLDRDMAWSA